MYLATVATIEESKKADAEKWTQSYYFCLLLFAVILYTPLNALAASTEVIPRGDTWMYFKGTQDPPENWNAIDCPKCDLSKADSGWKKGCSGFGYTDYDDCTTLSDMQGTGGYITLYLRKTFKITDKAMISGLVLTMYYDDSFVAYLNGERIAWENIIEIAPDKRYSRDQKAIESVEAQTVHIDISEYIDRLIDGDNVLAVEGHNVGKSSSDFSLMPILSVETKELPILSGDSWNYFKGTTLPPGQWNELICDECSLAKGWLKGRSGFGYEDDDDRTILGQMQKVVQNNIVTNPGYSSVYLRKEFYVENFNVNDINDSSRIRKLIFSIDYDDGFVAYLNGKEIAKGNITTGDKDKPLSNTTLANGDREWGLVEIFDVSKYIKNHLKPGLNVLAVEGHNKSLGSSDFSLNPRLMGNVNELPILPGDNWSYYAHTKEPSKKWKTIECKTECEPKTDGSGWQEGPSGFGYNDNDDATTLSEMKDNYSTVYLRKKFTVVDRNNIDSLVLSVDYDDGFIAFLNGTKVASGNMEKFIEGVTKPHEATADTDHEAGIAEIFDITNKVINSKLLVDGENVIAIQGYNKSKGGSSDFSLHPTLTDKPVILVGAGDIAAKSKIDGVKATGRVLDDVFQFHDSIGVLANLGDNAYADLPNNSYLKYYDPYWGSEHFYKTRPSLGNHEYDCAVVALDCTTAAEDYYNYFNTGRPAGNSPRAGKNTEGYYSYELGTWHIIVLNSCNVPFNSGMRCGDSNAGIDAQQMAWLKSDLKANRDVDILAYWHHPRYNVGLHPNVKGMEPVWLLMYEYGVDIVLNGHDHNYQRFEPKMPGGTWGTKDTDFGIRQFVIGTGGAGNYRPKENEKINRLLDLEVGVEASNFDTVGLTYGVLKLTLRERYYNWEFVSANGSVFRDSGGSETHKAPIDIIDRDIVDNGNEDTSVLYDVTHTRTDGGIGKLSYDSKRQKFHVSTGDNVGLQFSRSVSETKAGTFNIDFMPTIKYPIGGVIKLRLVQDENNYYEIEKTDGYKPGKVTKVVDGERIEVNYSLGYKQGKVYNISVEFNPSTILVNGFGKFLGLVSDSTDITVKSFEVELLQQDAYFDNIEFLPKNASDVVAVKDTDSDGVSDNEEIAGGTNPFDKGSVNPVLNTTLCAEWNGNFGMFNYYEHQNLSDDKALDVVITLYDINGVVQNVDSFVVPPGTQFDYPVHDMNGFQKDAYGRVCSTHNGLAGEMDGRMVHYLQNDPLLTGRSSGEMQFAFSMSASNGKTGSQFVPFNTFQPSLYSSDAGNLVANWIQISNLSDKSTYGRLFFYNMDGSVLGDANGERVVLNAGQRLDRAAHEFGSSLVGLVEWRPDNENVAFMMRNVRYLYDNPGYENSFDSAFQLEGVHGSGELLAVPLDTRDSSSIIEVFNTLAIPVFADVKIYNSSGALVTVIELSEGDLPGHGSMHIITDTILGLGKQGLATIEGSVANSVSAVVMQYRRNASLGVEYMYGISAEQSVGSALRGSYNTFIGQESELVMLNTTSVLEDVNISMVRLDQTEVLSGYQQSVPATGRIDLGLDSFESEQTYGTVTLAPTKAHSIRSWVLRKKDLAYVIVTPMR